MPHPEPSEVVAIDLTPALMIAWLVGAMIGRVGWSDAERVIDGLFLALSEVPVADEADQGARDALRGLAVGASVAARTEPAGPLPCRVLRPVPMPAPTRIPPRLRSIQRVHVSYFVSTASAAAF